MTKEQEVLLCVLKHAINGDSGDKFDADYSDIDWKAFVKESIYQAVSYIAFEHSSCLTPYIPQNIYKKWSDIAVRIAVSNVNVINSQNDFIKILGGNYRYVILKGLAAASYYPDPDFRSFGDVDFLVKNDDCDSVKSLLIESGFEFSTEDNDHHLVFTRPKSHLEMHFEIPGIPYGEIGDKVRAFMDKVFDDCESVSLDNGLADTFYAPDKVRHGLILILHMQHHMLGEGLGLRHLMDWACFVNATHREEFWDKKLLPFFKEIGIFVYAAAMTKTCALYLGSVCPEWCKDVSEELCGEIMRDVFSLGNFGVKDSEKSRSGALISEHGKDGTKQSKCKHLWKQFNASVKSRHKSLEKHKILYPIFYVYEFFRYTFESMRGKKPKLNKLLKDAEKRKSVYEKLHVFETGKENK